MSYESYESGRSPFVPDIKRGYWTNPNDFVYAGLSLAFRLDVTLMPWFFNFTALVPVYLISLFLYIVPFMVIQSFMGQFSSSGFISAFRLTPLFKGIGYATLALNICVLSYYSIFAMVPLVYMFETMQSIMPWECESFKKWAKNFTKEGEINLCNIFVQDETMEEPQVVNHKIPSVLYFKNLFNQINLLDTPSVEFSMSWELILSNIFVWFLVMAIFYRLFFNNRKLGQVIRYIVWTLLALLVLFLLRFSLVPGASTVYNHAFIPTCEDFSNSFFSMPIFGLSSFGPGWGLFITLSSFNKFKTNIVQQSWLIGIGQLAIVIGLDLMDHLSKQYFEEIMFYYADMEFFWSLYLTSASVMARWRWANMWTFLFYLMLFLAALVSMLIQLFSILTTIFDEFVSLRKHKHQVCLGVMLSTAAMSLYFTTSHGVTHISALFADTYVLQAAINLLLVLSVLWIYGRQRFQNDIEFMINQRLSTWNINIIKYAAPLGLIVALKIVLFPVLVFVSVYLIGLIFYTVPFMVIQSFMGQFSSSGFISTFRLAPLFKGVGYVTLALNICVLSYFSIFAMIPLFYIFGSLQPTMPWECEEFQKWAPNSPKLDKYDSINLCNMYSKNKTYPIGSMGHIYKTALFVNHRIPSVLYFKSSFQDLTDFGISISSQMLLCALLVWSIVILFVWKFFNTEKFGRIIRYTVWTLLVLLFLFVVRFSFLPGSDFVYRLLLKTSLNNFDAELAVLPLFGLSLMGPGWGLFITLSSFNRFKTNFPKKCWFIGLAQMFVIMGFSLLANLTKQFFTEITDDQVHSDMEHEWVLYLSSASAMSYMPWANMWIALFHLMLFLAAMLLIIIQLYSIMTAIFDEFVTLREHKLKACMGVIGVTAALSIYFSSNEGIESLEAVAANTYLTQIALNLLLILIVLWVYGRIRLQRDMEFMIGQRLALWKILLIRFVAPLGMLIAVFSVLRYAYFYHFFSHSATIGLCIIFIGIPWLFIPGYAIYSIYQSVGSFVQRFKRNCRPTDWYPVQHDHRQRYEDVMGNLDISHQLDEVNENVHELI